MKHPILRNLAALLFMAVVCPSGASAQVDTFMSLVFAGERVSLTSVPGAAPGNGYQWEKDQAEISGATYKTRVISSVKAADAGNYVLWETTQFTGSSQRIKIKALVSIYLGVVVRNPGEINIAAGTPLRLSCQVTVPRYFGSSGVVYYTWYRGGETLGSVLGGSGTLDVLHGDINTEGDYHYRCEVSMYKAGADMVTLANTTTRVRVFVKPALRAFALPELFVGQSVDTTMEADHRPARFTVARGVLPYGVTLDPATGRLRGRPLVDIRDAAGHRDYALTFRASNLAGFDSGSERTVTWRIRRLPVAAPGAYHALLAPHELNRGLGGKVRLDITNSGRATCQLKMGHLQLPALVTDLQVSADASRISLADVEIRRGRDPSLILNLDILLSTGALTGTVRQGGSTSCGITGWRQLAAAAVKADYFPTRGVSSWRYHAALLPPALGGNDPAEHPQGEGYAVMILNTAGTASWSGWLADGTSFTASANLCEGGRVPLHAIMNANLGGLHGWTVIDQPGHTLLDGQLIWRKLPPAPPARLPLNYASVAQQMLTLQGGKYTLPPAGTVLLGLAAPANVREANAVITFAAVPNALPASFSQAVSLSGRHVLTRVLPYVNSATAGFAAGTGLLTGGYTLAHAEPLKRRAATYRALVVPRLGRACGYHLTPLTPTGTERASTMPQRSAPVSLAAPPPAG